MTLYSPTSGAGRLVGDSPELLCLVVMQFLNTAILPGPFGSTWT